MRLLPNSGKHSWRNYNLETVYWLAVYKDRIRVLPKSRFIYQLSLEPQEHVSIVKRNGIGQASHIQRRQRMSVLKGLRARKAGRWKKRWARRERIEGTKEREKKTYEETALISFPMRTRYFTLTPLPISIIDSPRSKANTRQKGPRLQQLSQALK